MNKANRGARVTLSNEQGVRVALSEQGVRVALNERGVRVALHKQRGVRYE